MPLPAMPMSIVPVFSRLTIKAPIVPAPAAAAFAATRDYYRQGDARPWLARAGFLRLSARRQHMARRRALAAAKIGRVQSDARA